MKFDPLLKNFNIGHIFWMVSDRAFIFHMCVPYDRTFLLVPKFLTLWPWSLTHFLKTFTLAISFEWEVIGLLYFIYAWFLWQDLYIGAVILKSWPWVLTMMATSGICLVWGHLCFITHLFFFSFVDRNKLHRFQNEISRYIIYPYTYLWMHKYFFWRKTSIFTQGIAVPSWLYGRDRIFFSSHRIFFLGMKMATQSHTGWLLGSIEGFSI
jgi:hypothetical protein